MSIETDIEAMRSDLEAEVDPTAFLDGVLSATSQTLSDGEKDLIVVTHTREQIMTRFATEANL